MTTHQIARYLNPKSLQCRIVYQGEAPWSDSTRIIITTVKDILNLENRKVEMLYISHQRLTIYVT